MRLRIPLPGLRLRFAALLLLALCAISAPASAANCWRITGWLNSANQPSAGNVGDRANLVSTNCVAPAPSGWGWLQPTLGYSAQPPGDLYVRISLSDPRVIGGGSGYFSGLLLYDGIVSGKPVLKIDLLLCGGCSNKMNFVHQVGPCTRQVTWWNGTVMAGYDTANCYVGPPPAGSTPLIVNNSYYVAAQNSTICQIGGWDTANCYYGPAPAGATIRNNGFYAPAGAGNTCAQGTFNGVDCHIATVPPGSAAFLYAGNYYATTRRCAVGRFDGTRCYLGTPPSFPTPTVAFIWDGIFYYGE